MIFDYYASLAKNEECLKEMNQDGLVSGFVDGCTVWSRREKPQDKKAPDPKNEARQYYMKRASELPLNLPQELNLEADHAHLPDSTWFSINVSFTLETPWYSKDDHPFHVLDNPVRKDRVFGVPFMSAASWKGLLRWAYEMKTGVVGPCLETDQERIKNKKKEIVHLFGNERGEQTNFKAGALVFYPTWFKKIGFEVINPHSRARRAGVNPIYYEVVPAGTEGKLCLLYAPAPGEAKRDQVTAEMFDSLIDGIKALLETYGISAKRTAGWGTAKINDGGWKLYPENGNAVKTTADVKARIKSRIAQEGGGQ